MIANVVDAVHAIVILADFCFALDCSSSVYGGCHDDVMLLHRTASTYVRTVLYCTYYCVYILYVLYVLLCVRTVRMLLFLFIMIVIKLMRLL